MGALRSSGKRSSDEGEGSAQKPVFLGGGGGGVDLLTWTKYKDTKP
jgi:hypothetical protein